MTNVVSLYIAKSSGRSISSSNATVSSRSSESPDEEKSNLVNSLLLASKVHNVWLCKRKFSIDNISKGESPRLPKEDRYRKLGY